MTPLLYSIVLFLCLITFFFSFLSNTLHEHVANGILHRPKVLYFSSIFLMGGNTDILIFLWV